MQAPGLGIHQRQPEFPAGLDESHPLRKKIAFAFYGFPYVTGGRSVLSGTVRSVGQYGRAATITGTGVIKQQSDVSRTVFVACRNTASSGIIQAGAGGVAGWALTIPVGNQTPVWTDYGVASYTLPILWSAANEWQLFAIRRDRGSANDVRLFNSRGDQVGSAVAGGSYVAGSYEFTSTTTPTSLVLVVEDALSQEAIRQVLANPWQVFEPDPIDVYWATAAGTQSGDLSSSGSAVATAAGASLASANLSGTASAAATAAGASIAAANLSAAGTSTGTLEGSAVSPGVETGDLSAAGSATATGAGASIAASALSAAGTSVGTLVGTTSGGVQTGDLSAAGSATATAAGGSIAAAAMSAGGSATARAVGSDASQTTVTRYDGWLPRAVIERNRKKRRDADLIAIIAAIDADLREAA